jgi:hypothetical protein
LKAQTRAFIYFEELSLLLQTDRDVKNSSLFQDQAEELNAIDWQVKRSPK